MIFLKNLAPTFTPRGLSSPLAITITLSYRISKQHIALVAGVRGNGAHRSRADGHLTIGWCQEIAALGSCIGECSHAENVSVSLGNDAVNSPPHTGASPDHRAVPKHVLFLLPFKKNPALQVYVATWPNVVSVKTTRPSLGLLRGPQSMAMGGDKL